MPFSIDLFFLDNLLDPVNALIDISDAQLDDQLLELEKLTTIDQAATAATNPKTTPSTSHSGDNLVELLESAAEHERMFSDLLSAKASSTSNDLHGSNQGTSFETDWTAAFGNTSDQPAPFMTGSAVLDDPGTSQNTFLPSSLLSELLTSANKGSQPSGTSAVQSKPKVTKANEKSNWLDLFAELDPIQNPDAIGKSSVDEADRNC